jgi:tetratricopeptide (TPR) repeat protein
MTRNPTYRRESTMVFVDDRLAAIDRCNERLALDPEDGETLIERGRLFLDAKLADRALEDFDQAVNLVGTAKAHYFRGLALQRLLQHREAVVCFTTSMALDEERSDYLAARFRSHAAIGNAYHAREDLHRLRQLDRHLAAELHRHLPDEPSSGTHQTIPDEG